VAAAALHPSRVRLTSRAPFSKPVFWPRDMSRSVAPRHLSSAARRLFTDVVRGYALEAHHVALLVKALEAFDRAEQARVLIDAEGLIVRSRLGEARPHPAVAVERDSRAAFGTLMKLLALDVEAPSSPSQKRR